MGAMLFLLFLILFCGEMLKKKKIKGVPEVFGTLRGGTKELALRSECRGLQRWLRGAPGRRSHCRVLLRTQAHIRPQLEPPSWQPPCRQKQGAGVEPAPDGNLGDMRAGLRPAVPLASLLWAQFPCWYNLEGTSVNLSYSSTLRIKRLSYPIIIHQ